MENSKLTVCCLVYNHAPFIRQSMDGILMQKTDFPFDIVIHDDASTDGTEEILREYAKAYPDKITLLTETENQYSQGVRIVADLLMPRVTGKYFCICEGDDYWSDPQKLQRQYDALEQNPACSVCVHRVQCVDEEGNPIDRVFPPVDVKVGVLTAEEYISYEVGQSKWMFQTTSVLLRSEFLPDYMSDAPGFINIYRKAGDLQLMLYCLTKGDAWFIDAFMSCYRVGVKGSVGERLIINKNFRIAQRKGYIATLERYNTYTQGRFEKHIRAYQLRAEFGYLMDEGNYAALRQEKFRQLYENLNFKQRAKIALFRTLPFTETLYESLKKTLWNIRHKR